MQFNRLQAQKQWISSPHWQFLFISGYKYLQDFLPSGLQRYKSVFNDSILHTAILHWFPEHTRMSTHPSGRYGNNTESTTFFCSSCCFLVAPCCPSVCPVVCLSVAGPPPPCVELTTPYPPANSIQLNSKGYTN